MMIPILLALFLQSFTSATMAIMARLIRKCKFSLVAFSCLASLIILLASLLIKLESFSLLLVPLGSKWSWGSLPAIYKFLGWKGFLPSCCPNHHYIIVIINATFSVTIPWSKILFLNWTPHSFYGFPHVWYDLSAVSSGDTLLQPLSCSISDITW